MFGRPVGSNGEPLKSVPHCPRCESENGSLGTQNAYFCCRDCGREQYWTIDGEPSKDWQESIRLSPYGRLSCLDTHLPCDMMVHFGHVCVCLNCVEFRSR